jgi:hypothetical protein
MSNEYLAQVPINGFELEQGSQVGLELKFAWLQRQLKLGGKLKHNETMSQINIKEDGVVIFVKEKNNVK